MQGSDPGDSLDDSSFDGKVSPEEAALIEVSYVVLGEISGFMLELLDR